MGWTYLAQPGEAWLAQLLHGGQGQTKAGWRGSGALMLGVARAGEKGPPPWLCARVPNLPPWLCARVPNLPAGFPVHWLYRL